MTNNFSRRKFIITSVASVTGVMIPALPALAQANQPALGFKLPYNSPPSLDKWFVRQFYGNTRAAFRQRRSTYVEGQGLHFGIDFSAPCGTNVVAIADGVVSAVDGPFGSPPHNVVLRHSTGYCSLYGHLLQRSGVRVGDFIKAGQTVGLTGAPTGGDCDTNSHLHLEIRSLDMSRAFNPVPMINADWHALTLGLGGGGFEVDLSNPSRWQSITDQPTVIFGGSLLNNYERSWPGQV